MCGYIIMCKVQVKIKDTDGDKKQENEMELIRRNMKIKCIKSKSGFSEAWFISTSVIPTVTTPPKQRYPHPTLQCTFTLIFLPCSQRCGVHLLFLHFGIARSPEVCRKHRTSLITPLLCRQSFVLLVEHGAACSFRTAPPHHTACTAGPTFSDRNTTPHRNAPATQQQQQQQQQSTATTTSKQTEDHLLTYVVILVIVRPV